MIGDILKEAQAEINEELAKEIKAKIKTQLKKIATALVRTNEIIVSDETVDTLLAKILEMQGPNVKAIL